MFWVIQNNIFSENNYEKFVYYFDLYNIPFQEVKIIPFVHEIEPDVGVDIGPVMCIGGLTMHKIAKKKFWYLGSFLNDNFNYKLFNDHWKENMLNYDAIYANFGDIKQPPWEEFFIRPTHDSKACSGHVTNWTNFSIWRKKIVKDKETYTHLDENTEMILSSPKQIYSEFRFFILDGRIVTYSQYKMGGKAYLSVMVDNETISFVEDMIKIWQPARAFVIDVAKTENGMKIVEINNFNSSGLYYCEPQKIIEAIETMPL